ncbi:MAG: ribonuclease P protein component [Comamonas sp.]|nr:ribonuclease P protein component [Comamonas sp.]
MQRLKTRAQFQAVMAGGICSRTPHFVLHRLALNASTAAANPAAPHQAQHTTGPVNTQALFVVSGNKTGNQHLAASWRWLGPLVPKRWARRSVTRHLLRRQIYAVGADFAPRLPANTAYVVRLRSEFSRKQFISASSEPLRLAIRAELQHLFAYAVRKAEEAGAAP